MQETCEMKGEEKAKKNIAKYSPLTANYNRIIRFRLIYLRLFCLKPREIKQFDLQRFTEMV